MTSALSERVSATVGGDRLAVRHADQAPQHSEVEESERELARAGRDPFEPIVPVAVSGRRQLRLVDDEVDGHAWEDCPSLIDDPSDDATLRLRVGSRRNRQDCDDSG